MFPRYLKIDDCLPEYTICPAITDAHSPCTRVWRWQTQQCAIWCRWGGECEKSLRKWFWKSLASINCTKYSSLLIVHSTGKVIRLLRQITTSFKNDEAKQKRGILCLEDRFRFYEEKTPIGHWCVETLKRGWRILVLFDANLYVYIRTRPMQGMHSTFIVNGIMCDLEYTMHPSNALYSKWHVI